MASKGILIVKLDNRWIIFSPDILKHNWQIKIIYFKVTYLAPFFEQNIEYL